MAVKPFKTNNSRSIEQQIVTQERWCNLASGHYTPYYTANIKPKQIPRDQKPIPNTNRVTNNAKYLHKTTLGNRTKTAEPVKTLLIR